jgi:hypothetical protein
MTKVMLIKVLGAPSSDQHHLSNLQVFAVAEIFLFSFVEGEMSIWFYVIQNGDGASHSNT